MSDLTKKTWDEVMALSSGLNLTLGPNTVDRYIYDPKRICFFLSRYKFAAKMLKNCRSIVDVGCGDGMGTLTFAVDTQAEHILGVDFDYRLIGHASNVLLPCIEQSTPSFASKIKFIQHDVLKQPIPLPVQNGMEGLACLDVIEHIEEAREHDFLSRLSDCLVDYGVAVIGTPNDGARQHGSKHSELGHINNYDSARLHKSLEKHFNRVFMFSMNDEIVHTGFDKLAHYLIAVCVK
ncbi:class I SAM-dependent methyltransferase [Daejeonella sp.]|uniref:class I SAM-dependent methyltransferase n=1 Tax=Daejeonella sp. TaxID=2805397 RepID=UPI0030C463E8